MKDNITISNGDRKRHRYLIYTFSTDKEKDYFTLCYEEHFVDLENKNKIIEHDVEKISGMVYYQGTVYFTR